MNSSIARGHETLKFFAGPGPTASPIPDSNSAAETQQDRASRMTESVYIDFPWQSRPAALVWLDEPLTDGHNQPCVVWRRYSLLLSPSRGLVIWVQSPHLFA